MRSRTGRLEVSYRGGRPEYAYLYVSRRTGKDTASAGCIEVEPDMLLEIDEARELIGIEFLSPELATPEAVNRALAEHRFEPIDAIHLGPLRGSSEESSNTNTGHLLTATFVEGRLWAGYLYLSKRREKSAGSRRVSDEMVIDMNRQGDLIGIEFLDSVSYVDVHLLLMEHGFQPLPRSELKPILID